MAIGTRRSLPGLGHSPEVGSVKDGPWLFPWDNLVSLMFVGAVIEATGYINWLGVAVLTAAENQSKTTSTSIPDSPVGSARTQVTVDHP